MVQSHRLELKREFEKYCAANDNEAQKAYHRIMMVGALPDSRGVPAMEDQMFLLHTLSVLKEESIPVHPDFEIDIVNIDTNHGGRDFLKEGAQTDIVILCFVFNPSAEIAQAFYTDQPQGTFAISKVHHAPMAWHDAAVRVGAKVISVFGDDTSEVGPKVFHPSSPGSCFVMKKQGKFGGSPHILVRKPEGS